MFTSTLILGLVLGGTYALAALGLTLQYGIGRIMNLAYGELIIAASFGALIFYTATGLSPVVGLIVIVPAAYVLSWLVYAVMLQPLVARSAKSGRLEIDSILATFGLLFVVQGILLIAFGGDYAGYTYLNVPVSVAGAAIAANRLLAFALAVTIAVTLYLVIRHTRWGLRMLAVAYRPQNAPLVGIDTNRTARTAFALGGALAATGGVMISMFQTFTAVSGVGFTMKALIIVIMGGVGNMAGALLAGLMLGLAETFVASYIDPGLTIASTYVLFLAVLIWRPAGLFGRQGG